MVGAADANVLALLTRAPSAGGKTRLFRSLGIAPDPALLEALLLDTLDGAAAPGVRRVVAVTPASACPGVDAILGDVEVMAQGEGDLGARMRAAMAALFAGGASAVALIGSDLPHVSSALVAAAFDLVSREPDTLVLGPAADGGYYLVAARRLPNIFDGIEWGTDRVLAQTESAARRAGFHVKRVDVLTDVDTEVDLRRAVLSGRAHRTAAWLRAHDGRAPG
jgi:rSAM/selenodomain-associated transferase 1